MHPRVVLEERSMTGHLNDGHSSSVHPNLPSSLGLHLVLPCHRTGW